MQKQGELTAGQKKGCFGCLGVIVVVFIVLFIVIYITMDNATKEEDLSKEELAEIQTIISNFEANTSPYIAATNGVVKEIKMRDVEKSDAYVVNVYIDEASWAKSTESEKASVAATIGRQMNDFAGETKIYMYIKSYENQDTLAEPKIGSEGYKIIR